MERIASGDHHVSYKLNALTLTSLRDGYVDIHIMLSSPKVASQLLVYERQQGMLNEVAEIGKGMSIAVYQLPFWHYTTPMLARAGTDDARRWLLLASYFIDRKVPRPRRRSAKATRS